MNTARLPGFAAVFCSAMLLAPVLLADEIVVPAAIGQAAVSPEAAAPAVREPIVRESFGSSDIKDWYAPDDRTVVIGTYAHGKFIASFASTCTGIRFADALGFTTQGPFELDSSTTIVLPDGQRCFFKDLSAYSADQEKQDRAARAKPAAVSK